MKYRLTEKIEKQLQKMTCPTCEETTDVKHIIRGEFTRCKGADLTFTTEFYRCTKCQTEFETPDQVELNLLSVETAYNKLVENKQHQTRNI